MTQQAVTTIATDTLAKFPSLRSHVSVPTIERAVAVNWPDPPPPLVFWLWVAGSDLLGHEAAFAYVESIEWMIALLAKGVLVHGAWRSRLAKLKPPKEKAGFDHVTEFRAALFELIAGFRLATAEADIALAGEGAVPAPDLAVTFRGKAVAQVEAYGPQKGVDQWYETQVYEPWRRLLAGQRPNLFTDQGIRDISFGPDAIVQALSNVLTDSNFAKQKARQIAAAHSPAILMVRSYGLTPRLEELIATPKASELAKAIPTEAWNCLPQPGIGILFAFVADVVRNALLGPRYPVIFIPKPGATVSMDVRSYLNQCGMVSRDVLAEWGLEAQP